MPQMPKEDVDMKKLLVLIVVLGVLAVLPLAAIHVSVSEAAKGAEALEVAGEFWVFGNYNFSTDPAKAASGFVKAEMNFNYKLDEYNTVQLELDSEGDAWNNYVLLNGSGDAITGPIVQVDDWRIVSDVGGALKLPVKLTTTIGYFDTYFTDWDYVSAMGWEFYYGTYGWPNLLATPPYGPETGGGGAPDPNGAWQVDLGVGPVTLHWWNDFFMTQMLFGVSGAVGPVSGWVTYQDLFANGFGKGIVGVEAKYSGKVGDLALGVPAFFRYDLNNKDYTFGGGVSGDYKIAHLAFGLEGANVSSVVNHMVVEASVSPMEGLKAMATGYFALHDSIPFSAAVLEITKSIGKMNALLGYVIGGGEGITVAGDNFGVHNGMFFGVEATY
jgi:hypothetical protein